VVAPPATPAVEPPPVEPETTPGGKLADVRLVGAKSLTRETALFYLELRPGDPWDEKAVISGFRKLWEAGILDDLRMDRESTSAGTVLVLYVKEKARITTVDYEGNRKVSNSEIKDKLKEAKAEIKDGSPFARGPVNRLLAAVAELYESRGYKGATVDWKLAQPDKPESKLVVVIDEGDKTKIESINFTGNTVVPWWWLRWKMEKLTEAAWWKFWTSADVYNRASFDDDAQKIKQVYQEFGYKNVQVGDPIVAFETFQTTTLWTREKKTERRVHVTIPIQEGEKFYFGKIRIEGAEVFKGEQLLGFFDCPEGAVLKRSRFDEGLTAMESLYRRAGHIYVFANPDFVEREDHRVDITVKVTEGERYTLGRVEFLGNTNTRDKVLRREMKLSEGEIMDMEAFKTSMYKIHQLGFFKLTEDPAEFKTDQETHRVDVTIKGEEIGKHDIQFAGGYSEIDGFFGQFQFNTRNFLGNGESIGVSYQSGRRTTYFELGYTNPWFLDKRNVLGVSVFNRSLKYSDLERKSKGASFLFGMGLRDFEMLSGFYNYERIDASYTTLNPGDEGSGGGTGGDDGLYAGQQFDLFGVSGGDPIDDGPAIERVNGTTSSFTPTYRYDSRNDPMDPTMGLRFSFATEIAGGILGGTNQFVKPELHFTNYRPVFRNVTFAINAEGGWIIPYGNEEIPLFERYRLGGERTIRGFGFGSIMPRKPNGSFFFTSAGSRMGGDKYLLFNFETILTVAGPLKLVAFFDAGNTWLEGQGARIPSLRTSAGAEARIFIPIFQAPLRFIYGINLDPLTGEDKTDFQFTIGTNF
jgi:outer membrane protein insertion porin family